MRLIDADSILNCECKNNFNECDTCVDSELCELLNKAPSISLDEGVKIIWSAQIDDLIEKMKRLKGRKDNSVQYERGISDCIKILEEAKN